MEWDEGGNTLDEIYDALSSFVKFMDVKIGLYIYTCSKIMDEGKGKNDNEK